MKNSKIIIKKFEILAIDPSVYAENVSNFSIDIFNEKEK